MRLGDGMKKYLVLPLLLLSGCAYYQPVGVSSTNIGSQYERPVGIAQGHATKWYFFPCYALCQVGEDSIKDAIDNALRGQPGDALANVYVERKTVYFPHMFLPLIGKSELVVTGTVVKYTSKEFPPDNEAYLYSEDPEVIWSGLVGLKPEDQVNRIKILPALVRADLADYAEGRECALGDGTPDAILFRNILGWKPRNCVVAAVPSESAAKSVSPGTCKTYECLVLASPQVQISRVKELKASSLNIDRQILADIVRAGEKRIRVCRGGRIYTDPETLLNPGEYELLTHLCEDGEFK